MRSSCPHRVVEVQIRYLGDAIAKTAESAVEQQVFLAVNEIDRLQLLDCLHRHGATSCPAGSMTARSAQSSLRRSSSHERPSSFHAMRAPRSPWSPLSSGETIDAADLGL